MQNAADECGHSHYGNVVPLVKKETSYKSSIYGASTDSFYRNVENTSNMHKNGRFGMLDKNPSYWVPTHRDTFGKVEIANTKKLAFTYCQLEKNAYDETIPSTPHMLLETKPSVMAEFEFSQLERRACTTICPMAHGEGLLHFKGMGTALFGTKGVYIFCYYVYECD